MTRNNILFGFVLTMVAVILFYSFRSSESQEDYVELIQKYRREVDSFMKSSEASPFASDSVEYRGLSYFDPNPEYRIMAKYSRLPESNPVRLITSDGKDREYQRIAIVEFELLDRMHKLVVLESDEAGIANKFIPFADSSSGGATYGGGRYLDVKGNPSNNRLQLDFNLAYNPYCAYSESFSCPLPPAENFLAISILAGEKNYD